MKRRNLLRNLFLFIFAILFGYTVKKEDENMVLQLNDSSVYNGSDGKSIVDEIKVLTKNLTQTVNNLNDRGLNVKEFGAKGDGISDDTEAFKKALLKAKKGKVKTVFVPDGKYLIIDTLEMYSFISLVGTQKTNVSTKSVNENSCEILFRPSTEKHFLIVKPDNSSHSSYGYSSSISNIRVTGNTLTFGMIKADTCIFLDRSARTNLENVSIYGFKVGLHVNYGMTNTFRNVGITRCTETCLLIDSDVSVTTSQIFQSCTFREAPWGVIIKQAIDNYFYSCLIETTYDGGVNIHRGASAEFYGTYVENVPNGVQAHFDLVKNTLGHEGNMYGEIFRCHHDVDKNLNEFNDFYNTVRIEGGNLQGSSINPKTSTAISCDYTKSAYLSTKLGSNLNGVVATKNTLGWGVHLNGLIASEVTNLIVDPASRRIGGSYREGNLSSTEGSLNYVTENINVSDSVVANRIETTEIYKERVRVTANGSVWKTLFTLDGSRPTSSLVSIHASTKTGKKQTALLAVTQNANTVEIKELSTAKHSKIIPKFQYKADRQSISNIHEFQIKFPNESSVTYTHAIIHLLYI
ncbi:glycosyl hydrolase family 28-related protein [Peribacillus butanolivorans]|uniref:glycosyl hydrolase family 28-related protein n=1 Tax=Peribacillus butanolivorans TaxID=421767 RepID=UPI003D2A9855